MGEYEKAQARHKADVAAYEKALAEFKASRVKPLARSQKLRSLRGVGEGRSKARPETEDQE